MRKITKKIVKKIHEGNFDTLIDSIGVLIDTYDSKPFDEGYQACLSDLRIYSDKLTEVIIEKAQEKKRTVIKKGETYYLLDEKELSPIIEEFFENIIKEQKNGEQQ